MKLSIQFMLPSSKGKLSKESDNTMSFLNKIHVRRENNDTLRNNILFYFKLNLRFGLSEIL